jgi:anthranilate synthase component 1
MYTPSRGEFKKLSEKYNLVPVYREIIADMDTPVSAFLKMGDEVNSFLLESVVGGEQPGRYSFIGSKPFLTVTARGNTVAIEGEENEIIENVADPLEIVESRMKGFNAAALEGLPPFFGGAVGYAGYDAVKYFEKLPDNVENDLKIPEMVFLFTDLVIAFDHIKHKIMVIANARINGKDPGEAYDSAIKRIDATIKKLRLSHPSTQLVEMQPAGKTEFSSNASKERFSEMVEKGKSYIYDGDIFQVVLSQRFSTPVKMAAFDIYRVLRTINPSPYMVYMRFAGAAYSGSGRDGYYQADRGYSSEGQGY